MNRPAVLLLVATLIIGGCATPHATPQQQTATEGAAIGAIAVGGLCALLGGDARTCIALAAAGAAVGGVAGYSYADSVVKRKKQLEGKENDLNARIAYVQGVNQDSAKFNQQLTAKLEASTAETDKLVAQVERGSASQQQIAKQRQKLEAETKAANDQVKVMEGDLADMQRFRASRSGPPSPELDSEIAKLEKTLAEAHQNTTALAALSTKV